LSLSTHGESAARITACSGSTARERIGRSTGGARRGVAQVCGTGAVSAVQGPRAGVCCAVRTKAVELERTCSVHAIDVGTTSCVLKFV
jgi:hypothetical protein